MVFGSAQAAPGAGAAQPPYPAALTVSSPSWHSRLAHGAQVPLVYPETYVGLMGANDIVLSDLGVSRIHAVIRWSPDGYTIQDLGSRHGTFVEGRQVTELTPLAPGARIRIGNAELVFQAVQVHDGAAPPPGAGPTPAPTMGSTTGPGGRHGPAGGAGPGVADMSAQEVERIAARAQRGPGIGAWLATQKDKRYWRVFLIGLAAYLVSLTLLSLGGSPNPHLIPLVLILASAVVPVSFVVYCWETGAFADISLTTLGLAFLGGGVVGISLTVVFGVLLGSLAGATLFIGVIEETGKGLAVALFLRDRRLRSELDGLVLGAAVGMGFAMIETAGYGLDSFTTGVVALLTQGTGGTVTMSDVYRYGVDAMVQELNVRMMLALFGHGIWTAIVGATIWRSRSRPAGEARQDLALGWGIAVLLHAIFDTIAFATSSLLPLVVVGVAGLVILRFFIQESVERARFGDNAPPPPPLARALRNYLAHLSQHTAPRAAATAAAFASAAPGYYAGAEQAAVRAFATFNNQVSQTPPPAPSYTPPGPSAATPPVSGPQAAAPPGPIVTSPASDQEPGPSWASPTPSSASQAPAGQTPSPTPPSLAWTSPVQGATPPTVVLRRPSGAANIVTPPPRPAGAVPPVTITPPGPDATSPEAMLSPEVTVQEPATQAPTAPSTDQNEQQTL